MKYNIWNAVAYEVTNFLIDIDTKWEMNRWIKMIRTYCFYDWVEWKTERTMKSVDRQVEELQEEMEAEDKAKYVDPVVIEHEPDGSKAQELLGGTLEMRAPWVKDTDQE